MNTSEKYSWGIIVVFSLMITSKLLAFGLRGFVVDGGYVTREEQVEFSLINLENHLRVPEAK